MRYLKSQNSLVTRCKSCSRQEITRYSLQNLLVVVEVARCKKSLVTRCKIRPLLAVEVARCKNALVVKNHSLLVAKFDRYLLHKFTEKSILRKSLGNTCEQVHFYQHWRPVNCALTKKLTAML